ncbi:hypothetical protein QBC46DRAFT_363943 [Diplogelasinospora grovesii]|uniref:Uncharacterized protein n=1 Tax=Diplogelasinospora grovesii TaxID=303347 RepID=A0AAN6S4Y6_9PEZI|nr:hypothetical protein QBC46DRAFT_363943 [Diplogelasinospora grovesii]
MAATYDSGPEVAPQNYPEVAHHAPQPGPGQYGHQQPYQDSATPKPEQSPHAAYADPSTTYGSNPAASPYSTHAQTAPSHNKSEAATICGCSLLVFILSCIIALLSAAVIGLAAGTGVEASRANDATNKLLAMSSSVSAGPTKTTTVTAPAAAATDFNAIDDGCSNNPSGVNKTVYTSFSLLGGLKFTKYCNMDTPNAPLLSLFTADFDTCMDACAAFTKYEPPIFGNNINTTCAAVSFIPLWTNKVNATGGGAPGNCYLKPGPQNETALHVPNIGTECHAGILTGGS